MSIYVKQLILLTQHSQILWAVVLNESYYFCNASKQLGLIYLIHFRVQFLPPQWKLNLQVGDSIRDYSTWHVDFFPDSSGEDMHAEIFRFRSPHWYLISAHNGNPKSWYGKMKGCIPTLFIVSCTVSVSLLCIGVNRHLINKKSIK